MSINIYNKLFFNKYKILDFLGKGSFGLVFRAKNIKTGEDVAVKMQHWVKQGNILEIEAFFLYILKGKGFPEVISFGRTDKYGILVETLLGDSIESIFSKMNYNISVKDICMILLQLLDRLEFVHSKYVIHRDIKPENILVDLETKRVLYLIDFNLARKYRSSRTGKHIKFLKLRRFIGTARYASVNALRGMEQSRRDDLESLSYVLIYFARKGDLPWKGLNIADKIERFKKIYYIKRDIKLEDLCKGMETEFLEFIKYVKNLEFEEELNYSYLKSLLRKVLYLKNLHVYNNFSFSWLNHKEIKHPQTRILRSKQMSKDRENNSMIIKENKLINELEEKQEQREKELSLKKKIEKEKGKNLDIDNKSMDCTQMSIFSLSLIVEDKDEEDKINKSNEANININNYNNIKKESLSEKESDKKIKMNKGKIINNNKPRNSPIRINLSYDSFNKGALARYLTHYNFKNNNLIEKAYDPRNNRNSGQSPKLTRKYFLINKLSRNKENKIKSKENNNNINIINQKLKSSNILKVVGKNINLKLNIYKNEILNNKGKNYENTINCSIDENKKDIKNVKKDKDKVRAESVDVNEIEEKLNAIKKNKECEKKIKSLIQELNEEKINNINLKQKIYLLEKQLIEEKRNSINLVTEEKNNNKILKAKINFLEKELEKETQKFQNIENKSKMDLSETMYKKNKEIEELKIKLSRFPFELNEGEKIISVIFMTKDENIYHSIICKNTDKFSTIENELYQHFNELSKTRNYFTVNRMRVNRQKTLEENKIMNNDIIILNN